MLSVLHIENIAVIELADITFDDRLNVLTGETGAGKSIIIDALGALLGARTSRELIRSGCGRALVSAVFYRLPASAEAIVREIGAEWDEEILVSREMFPDGRNVCKVAGHPVTVAQLRELGPHLAQIHGQHDTQSLLSDDRHLGFLDAFARTDAAAYQHAYRAWKQIEREMDALRMDEDEKARRMDTLRYRLQEIEDAQLTPGEEAELLERRKLLRHAQRVIEALDGAYAGLLGGEDAEAGAIDLLDEAASSLRGAARYGESLGEWADRLAEIRYQAEDIAGELRGKREELELAPEELNGLESRLELLHRLKSKFGSPPDELISKMERWRQELDDITFAEEKLHTLEIKRAAAEQEAVKEAEKLTAHREKAAAALKERMVEELDALDMKRVRFDVEITEDKLGTDGADMVRFLLAANPGESLKPLSKTASGGELSRIMLAVKNVLAEADDAVSLVFDEVDSGVSGRAAQRVAEKLRQVAAQRQVLSVTHLPQIAAMADTHFRITKAVSGERTVTTVDRLTHDERVEELARIIGGSQITQATRDGAAELIAQATR